MWTSKETPGDDTWKWQHCTRDEEGKYSPPNYLSMKGICKSNFVSHVNKAASNAEAMEVLVEFYLKRMRGDPEADAAMAAMRSKARDLEPEARLKLEGIFERFDQAMAKDTRSRTSGTRRVFLQAMGGLK